MTSANYLRVETCLGDPSKCPRPIDCASFRSMAGRAGGCPWHTSEPIWHAYDDEHPEQLQPEHLPLVLPLAFVGFVAFAFGVVVGVLL